MTPKLLSWKPYLALLTVYLIWGTTAGCIKLGIDTIPSALLPCLRFTLAGILLVAFCLMRGEHFPSRQDLKTHSIVGLLLFLGGNSIICWTVKYITTGFSGILVATTPLWMVGLSALLPPREKIPFLSLVGLVIGFIGMAVLLSPQLIHINRTSPVFWLCIVGLLIMTFCWSLGSIYSRKFPAKTSLLMSVGLQNLVAGLALIPICLLTIHDWTAIQPSLKSVVALVYLVLMGTMTATPCYLYVLQTMSVSVSSTFAYVTPVITLIFGCLFLGEPIGFTMIVGAAIILAGVILVQYINYRWVTQRQNLLNVSVASPHQDADELQSPIKLGWKEYRFDAE
jgi:drug/metabolite transporter (DMT)-like permease